MKAAMMRTTVDLDRELLERARDALDADTFRETITRALEDVVARAEMKRLLSDLEDSDLTWGLDELLSYRRLQRGDSP